MCYYHQHQTTQSHVFSQFLLVHLKVSLNVLAVKLERRSIIVHHVLFYI